MVYYLIQTALDNPASDRVSFLVFLSQNAKTLTIYVISSILASSKASALEKVVLRRSINFIHEKQNYLSPGGRGGWRILYVSR